MSELKNVLEALDDCLARIDDGQDALTQALDPLEEAGQPHAFGVLLESRDAEAQQALTEAAQAAEDIVCVAQTLKRVHDIVTQYRHSIAEGVSSRSDVPSVSAPPKVSVESAPTFDTREWADDVRQRIQHRKPTLGLVFDDHGYQTLTDLDDLCSGPDAAAREIDAFLKNHPQFPEQRRPTYPSPPPSMSRPRSRWRCGNVASTTSPS
nr:hypothetical protein [Actinopolyspora halophila]